MNPKVLHIEEQPELYRLIAQSDTKAFSHAHTLYKTQLVYFAAKMVKDQHEIEDIISASFLALWRSREKLQSNAHLRNFLYVAVRHRAINYLETKQRQNDIIEPFSEESMNISEIPADEVQAELMVLINKAVKALPGEYGRIFELSYYEQLGANEIARILSMNPSTVRTQKQRAVQMIKEWIRQHLPMIIFFSMAGILAQNFFRIFFSVLRR